MGVPCSVNMVSKLRVSELNVSMSCDEVEKSSSIHDGSIADVRTPISRTSKYFIILYSKD